jgi:hypothetical protein
MDDFATYVNKKIKRLGIHPDCVFNIDETNVPFSLEQLYTWGQRGADSIAIRKPDSTARLSCLLGMNLTGTLKILPHLVYNGKKTRGNRVLKELKEQVGYPEDFTYNVQEKAWFDEDIFIDWVDNHWKPFMDLNGITFSYLLLDVCRVHMTARSKDALLAANIECDYIPAGYTSKLQPLDVGINAPFKSYIRNSVERYMMQHPEQGVKVHRRDVAWWISDAWAGVGQRMIVNSWRRCGYDTTHESIVNAIADANDILDYDDDAEDEEYNAIINNPYEADPGN